MNSDSQEIGQPNHLRLSFPQILLAPLRALLLGHIIFLIYILGLGLLTAWGLGEIVAYLPKLLRTSTPTPRWLLRIAETAVWLPVFPIVLALCVAPLRTIWLVHSLKFSVLIKFTVNCLGRSFQSLQLFMRQGLIWLLIPSGLLLGLQQIQPHLRRNPAPKELIFIVLATVGLIAILKVSQTVLLMLMVIGTNMEASAANYHKNGLLKGQLAKILAVDVLCITASYTSHLLIKVLNHKLPNTNGIEILLQSLIVWYFISAMTVLALEASENYAQQLGRTFRT